jgi:phosphate transport system permease protein
MASADMSLQALRRSIAQRKLTDKIFMFFALFCLMTGLLVLVVLIFQLFFGAIGFSVIDSVGLERTAIAMVESVGEDPDSPAKPIVSGLAKVVNDAKKARENDPEALALIRFTPAEQEAFVTELIKVYDQVNPYAEEITALSFTDDPARKQEIQTRLDATNEGIQQIYKEFRGLCPGRISKFGGDWLCKVNSRLDLRFISLNLSSDPESSGVKVAVYGSILVILVTATLAIVFGVSAGIFLEEYAPRNWFTNFIEININNLAGVPSIVYGLLALGFFSRQLGLGASIITGGCTLACLTLPIIIVTTRESIKSIPVGIREGAFALGASKWMTIKDHILPYSIGGILTGVIVGLSRAIGEAAPLITIGAATFITILPLDEKNLIGSFFSFGWLRSQFTVMPIQMFNWVGESNPGFQLNASAAGVVLVVMTLLMNGIAIYIRSYFRSRIKW